MFIPFFFNLICISDNLIDLLLILGNISVVGSHNKASNERCFATIFKPAGRQLHPARSSSLSSRYM